MPQKQSKTLGARELVEIELVRLEGHILQAIDQPGEFSTAGEKVYTFFDPKSEVVRYRYNRDDLLDKATEILESNTALQADKLASTLAFVLLTILWPGFERNDVTWDFVSALTVLQSYYPAPPSRERIEVPLRPLVRRGLQITEGHRAAMETAKNQHEKAASHYQRKANKLWDKNPSLSKRRVAEMITNEEHNKPENGVSGERGYSMEAIRKMITRSKLLNNTE